MEFRFNVNDVFKQPIVEIGHTLIPTTFKGDRRALWDTLSKVTDVVNAMGSASATAQNLTKPITTADRLRNSEQQTVYLLVDHEGFGGKGAVTGMLKTGKKGLYVFDREGHHYQVQSPCILDFYVHESRQRSGLGKKLFEHMLQKEQVQPDKLAIDRPSDKFLAFLQKHYNLTNPIRQMNNYVVYDGFFPEKEKSENAMINNNSETPSKQSANGLQPQITSPYGRYGAPRPPCSMGQIIHNQTSAVAAQEPSGEVIPPNQCNSTQENYANMSQNIETQKHAVSAPVPNTQQQMLNVTGQEAGSGLDKSNISNTQNVSGGELFTNYWPFAIPSKGYVSGPLQKTAPIVGSMYDIMQPDGNTDKLIPPQKVPLDSLGRPIVVETPTSRSCMCPHHHHYIVTNGSSEPAKIKHDSSLHPNNPLLQEVHNQSMPYNHFSKPIRPDNQQNLASPNEADQNGRQQSEQEMINQPIYTLNGNPIYAYNQQPQFPQQQYMPNMQNSQLYVGPSGNINAFPQFPYNNVQNLPMYQHQIPSQTYALQNMLPQMSLPDNMQQMPQQTIVPNSTPNTMLLPGQPISTDQNYMYAGSTPSDTVNYQIPSNALNYQNQLNNNYMQADGKIVTPTPESKEEKVTADDGDGSHVNKAPNYNAASANNSNNANNQEQIVAPVIQNLSDQFATNSGQAMQQQSFNYTLQDLNFPSQPNIPPNGYQVQGQGLMSPIIQQQNNSVPRHEYYQHNEGYLQHLVPPYVNQPQEQNQFNNKIHSDQMHAQFPQVPNTQHIPNQQMSQVPNTHQVLNQQILVPPSHSTYNYIASQHTTPRREQRQIYPVPNNQLNKVVTQQRNAQPLKTDKGSLVGTRSDLITSNVQPITEQRRYSCPPDLSAYQAQAGIKTQVPQNYSHVPGAQNSAGDQQTEINNQNVAQHAVIDNSKNMASPRKNMENAMNAGGDMKGLESEKHLKVYKKLEPLIPAELKKNVRTLSPVVHCPQLDRIHNHAQTKGNRRAATGVLNCRNPKSTMKKYENENNNDQVIEIR